MAFLSLIHAKYKVCEDDWKDMTAHDLDFIDHTKLDFLDKIRAYIVSFGNKEDKDKFLKITDKAKLYRDSIQKDLPSHITLYRGDSVSHDELKAIQNKKNIFNEKRLWIFTEKLSIAKSFAISNWDIDNPARDHGYVIKIDCPKKNIFYYWKLDKFSPRGEKTAIIDPTNLSWEIVYVKKVK